MHRLLIPLFRFFHGFPPPPQKIGAKFPDKSREAGQALLVFPKTEVLEQPQILSLNSAPGTSCGYPGKTAEAALFIGYQA
jgi:hypothetical protein